MRAFNYEICNPGSEVAKHPGGSTPYDGLYGEAAPERGRQFQYSNTQFRSILAAMPLLTSVVDLLPIQTDILTVCCPQKNFV